MAVAIKTLAAGQLPNTKTTLYTVPASTSALLTITLAATGASARTVNIYIKRSGGTSRRVLGMDTNMDPGDVGYIDHEGRPWSLATGDIVEGDASAATEIDYTIDGVERT